MKGQKSLRYLLVTAMLVVSIPIVAVGQRYAGHDDSELSDEVRAYWCVDGQA